MQRIRFSYFGYSVEFSTETVEISALRAEANAHTLAAHGPDGVMGLHNVPLPYVEPGLPYPDYVPAQVLTDEGWHSYL